MYELVKNDTGRDRHVRYFQRSCGNVFLRVSAGIQYYVSERHKESGRPYVEKPEVAKMYFVLIPLYLLMFLYMAVSAHLAGVSGFKSMFWTGYTEMMFVNAGDFFLLDVLARIYVKDKGLIKDAENHPDWEWKGWWKLAVPEHGLAWPVLVCPLTGLIVAGFAALM